MFSMIALIGCLLCSQAAPQPPAPLPADAPFAAAALGSVQLQLTLDRPELVSPRLPAPLTLTARNIGGEPIDVPIPSFSSQHGPLNTVDLYAARDAAASLERVRFVVPDFSPCKEGLQPPQPQLMRLNPGHSHAFSVPLSYDWDLDLPRPLIEVGSLRVQARLHPLVPAAGGGWRIDRDAGVASNTLTIQIPAPAGADAEVYRALKRRPRPWLLAAPEVMAQMPDEDGLMRFADKLEEQHPASIYNLYARAARSQMLAAGELRLNQRHLRRPDLDAAARLADEVERDPRWFMAQRMEPMRERIRITRESLTAQSEKP